MFVPKLTLFRHGYHQRHDAYQCPLHHAGHMEALSQTGHPDWKISRHVQQEGERFVGQEVRSGYKSIPILGRTEVMTKLIRPNFSFCQKYCSLSGFLGLKIQGKPQLDPKIQHNPTRSSAISSF